MFSLLLALSLQADPAPQSADVVVIARKRAQAAVLRQRIRRIARRSGESLARFDAPACPQVIGLPAPLAERFVARMRENARRADARVANADCRPNITVAFVPDGRELLQGLRREHPAMLRGVSRTAFERTLAEPGPARAVTLSETRSRDGARLSADYTAGNQGIAGGAPVLAVDTASFLLLASRQDIVGALLVIDKAGAVGKEVTQLADYASMRTLARVAEGREPDDTILSLFTAPQPPAAMTRFDRAYLRALYDGPATQPFLSKVRIMANAMAEEDSGEE